MGSGMRLMFTDGGEVALSDGEARQLGYVTDDGQVMLVTTRTNELGGMVVTCYASERQRLLAAVLGPEWPAFGWGVDHYPLLPTERMLERIAVRLVAGPPREAA
jgi:hypothetical protein